MEFRIADTFTVSVANSQARSRRPRNTTRWKVNRNFVIIRKSCNPLKNSSFDPLEIEMLALIASRVPGLSLKALAKTY